LRTAAAIIRIASVRIVNAAKIANARPASLALAVAIATNNFKGAERIAPSAPTHFRFFLNNFLMNFFNLHGFFS